MGKNSTIKGLPVFAAEITDESDGILRVSLVDFPAVESDFVAFADTPAPVPVVASEDAHIVHGVIMRANYPIYRNDANGEYWIVYRPAVIRAMAEKYIADNRANAVDLNHDGQEIGGVQLVQLYIKDTQRGICPKGFESIEDGSLFGEFHINNLSVWAAIKEGTYKGFSLEGYFSFSPSTGVHSTEKIGADILEWLETKLSTDMSIRQKLAKMLARFGATTTDKGIIHWEGDADLEEGAEVWAESEEGERVALEDGDYITEDGKAIVVKDGVVAEIKDAEAEVAPEEVEAAEGEEVAEPAEPAAEEEPAAEVEQIAEEVAEEVAQDAVAALEERISGLESRLAEVEANLAALVDILNGVTTAAEFKTARDRYKEHKDEVKTDGDDKFVAAMSRAKAVAAAMHR